RREVELVVDGRVRAVGGDELERSLPAYADEGKALDLTEAATRAPLRREPGIDQRVAEAIRQRVGDQPGQAVEGSSRQLGESVDAAFGGRHAQGRRIDAGRSEVRRVLEGSHTVLGERDGADLGSPELDRGDGHR